MKINKTNAARLLDKAKIAYELIPYEVDENDLSAIHVAASLGENIEQVFKTLVLHGDKSGYFVCVIPGEHEVDLKLAAKASGNKKGFLRGERSDSLHFHNRKYETGRWGTEYVDWGITYGIKSLLYFTIRMCRHRRFYNKNPFRVGTQSRIPDRREMWCLRIGIFYFPKAGLKITVLKNQNM